MKYTEIPEEYNEKYEAYFDLEKLASNHGHEDGRFRMDYVRDHPVPFAYYMLGIKLRKYQAYAIDRILSNQNTALCWSRQIGKSLTLAIFSLWAIRFNKYPSGFDKSTRIIYVSHTDDGSKKIIDEVNRFIRMGDSRVESVTGGKIKGFFSTKREGRNNMSQVTFKIRGKDTFIKSFPPTSKIVGNTGSILIIDECARLNLDESEDKFFKEYAEPTISAYPHAKRIYSSTPEGLTGSFYQLFDPNDVHDEHEFERIWFPHYIFEDEHYHEMMKEKKRSYQRDGKIKEFEQEYMASFVSSQGAYFSPDKHMSKLFDEDMYKVATHHNKCYMGIDFGGQRTSHTVITIVIEIEEEYTTDSGEKKKRDVIKRVWDKVYPVKGDSDLVKDVKRIVKRFPALTEIIVDSQGGAYAVPELRKIKPVTEMVFRRDKDIKYDQFRVKLFRNEINSYKDDYLAKEMYALTNELKAPRGYTDDAIDSFVIASYHYLGREKKFNFYMI